MLAKTHLAVGYASALLFTQPSTARELVLCLGFSTIGSLISDIDATTSESKKELSKVIAAVVVACCAIFAGDYFLHTNIISRFNSNENLMKLIFGFFILLIICIFGERQPHRSFMHSILGLAAISGCFSFFLPQAAEYIAISMTSHILIDLLNKKKISLFYPKKKPRIGFGLCYSDGIINSVMFLAGSAASIALVAASIIRISKGYL